MAHKTLQMMIIAYNLMRTLMQQAAHEADEPVHHMSFKGTLDLVTSSHETFRIFAHKPRKRRAHYNALIELCATKTIDIRPFRQEPRVRKRRPKNYQLLTESRHLFQEISHREGYRKAA